MRSGFAGLLIFLSAQLCFSQHTGHQLNGYLREELTNVSVQNVALEVLSSGRRAAPPIVSGMDGEFQFAGLPDGDYYIVATKKGYDPITVHVSIMAGSAPPTLISVHRQNTATPSSTDESISARQLSIPEKARDAFEKGYRLLYTKSDSEKAIVQFQRAIELYPPYWEAYAKIGVADYRLNKFSEAETALRKAVEISAGKYSEALFLLAEMCNDQERFTDAEPLARQALAAGDSSWHGEFELARALVGLKRAREAEASALRARELEPDNAPIYLVLANAHLQQQKFASVVEDFDAYLKLAPNAVGSDQIRQRRDRMRAALQQARPQVDPPKH